MSATDLKYIGEQSSSTHHIWKAAFLPHDFDDSVNHANDIIISLI